MLREVHLHGHLGEKYGNIHRFDICNAAQGVRALAANYRKPGMDFFKDFRDGYYHVVVGDKEKGTYLELNTINFQMGSRPVHIIPAAAGAKGGGGLKIIAGLAMLTPFAWSFFAAAPGAIGSYGLAEVASNVAITSIGGSFVTYGNLASIGLSMLVSGISSAMTSVPKVQDYGARNTPDERASFLFNGATNRAAEGTAIPLVFGRFKSGSIIGSAGITIEQLITS